jgi:hypothetical protein
MAFVPYGFVLVQVEVQESHVDKGVQQCGYSAPWLGARNYHQAAAGNHNGRRREKARENRPGVGHVGYISQALGNTGAFKKGPERRKAWRHGWAHNLLKEHVYPISGLRVGLIVVLSKVASSILVHTIPSSACCLSGPGLVGLSSTRSLPHHSNSLELIQTHLTQKPLVSVERAHKKHRGLGQKGGVIMGYSTA